jgi:glycosyltransferase involved in cell wall biosynthesis
MATLSVIIPVYNEQATVGAIVGRVLAAQLPGLPEPTSANCVEPQASAIGLDVVLVDDGSTDASWQRMTELLEKPLPPHATVRLFRQPANRGKGAAIRRALAEAVGDWVIIQDADLEYDPADYATLLGPILAGQADVVYGSRFTGRRTGGFLQYLANQTLTRLSNLMTGLRLTDMETCYKLLSRRVVDGLRIELKSDGFDIEPEITARIARAGWRVREAPISYRGRDRAAGKKISWVDGLRAIWTIVKFRFLR